MPLIEYSCGSCGHLTEELLPVSEYPWPDVFPCESCGEEAREHVSANIGVRIGPEQHQLERYNSCFFSKAQRMAGMGVRSRRDIERFEDSNGFTRIEPGSTAQRVMDEDQNDEFATEDRIRREDGEAGVLRWQEKTEVQEKTGWSDAQWCAHEQSQEWAMKNMDKILAAEAAATGKEKENDNATADAA